MAYFYIAAEQRVTELDAALYARWVADNNPKAAYYTPISDPPGPNYQYDGTDWIAPPPFVPQQVTRFQAKAAMLGAGMLATVEAAVAASNDALLQLAWAEALSFERNSPSVVAMAQAMGLTDEQIDALFLAASQIEA